MDIVNSLTDKQQAAALLVLPKDDMISKSQNQSQRQTASSCSHPQLVLMQLPASLSVSDFQKAGNCRFLASTAPSSSLMSSQSCCLVVESQGATFDLVKVETSNALVLIPPSACSTITTDEPLLKRQKMDDDNNDDDKNHNRATELTSVHCRLLQAGGSGASFLELRPKSLSLKSLRSLLLPHLFDPYLQNENDTTTSMTAWQGRTVDSLAHELLISRDQIYQGLERVHALALTPNGNTDHCVSYGLLSEEALQESQCALLSALAECRDFEHYATAEIPYESLIQESKKRMNETYPYVDQVLRHCVETTLLLTNEATNIDSALMKRHKKRNYVRLDIKKVATCVAKQLFLKQKEPWEEEALLTRWQSELPGVGEDYEVSLDLLRGVAIRTTGTRWKYFAIHELPLEPIERFQALFQECDVWTLEDLDPYLQPLADETNLTLAELLHHHAKVVHQETEMGEAPVQLFSKL